MTDRAELSPEFNGECAFALSTGKKGVAGQRDCSKVESGKMYLFSNPIAKVLWSVLPGRRARAEMTWSRPHPPAPLNT